MVHFFDHPLIQHKLGILRDKNTGVKEFRQCVSEISALMCYEATRELPLKEIQVETPLATATAYTLAGRALAIVPILRGGLAMAEGLLSLIPSAKVGHLGLFRDTYALTPVEYYCKMPSDIYDRSVIILEPLMGTGGTGASAVQIIKNYGCSDIKLMNILSTQAALDNLEKSHPDISIYCAAVDEGLNDKGYILPGIGDAGDRMYGTK